MARASAPRPGRTADQPDGSRRASPTAPASAIAASLDRLLHDRVRLGIVSALAAAGDLALSFTELRSALRTTDGNLGGHVRKLEDAGYVSCEKRFAGRTPRTDYRLTAPGARALEKYLGHLDAIIQATRRR